MKDLYFALPIRMFNTKSKLDDKLNLEKYKSIVEKLREKYKGEYRIADDLDLIIADNVTEAMIYSTMCTMGTASLDGLVLPLNYKNFNDLKALKDVANRDNKSLFFFDEKSEQILTVEELKTLTETKEKVTTATVTTSIKYSITNGDADIEYEEINGKKIITVYHMGTVTKYEIK